MTIRSSAENGPDSERIEAAARLLRRQPFYKDETGREHEILGAAISQTGRLAYVESQTKQTGEKLFGSTARRIDVSIRIHMIDSEGGNRSVDIESYNPFFGCDVRWFEWIGDIVILIYREKHWTYACRFGDIWPPKFVKIEDDWLIHDNQLAFIGYKQKSVKRLTFPSLDALQALPVQEAAKHNLMPETYWT